MVWKRGQSGNPGGRRRNALSLAETIRRAIDPDSFVRLALEQVENETLPSAVRLQWWCALADRGYIRPPVQRQIEVTAMIAPALPPSWSSMTPFDREVWLNHQRQVALAGEAIDVDPDDDHDERRLTKASVTDDDAD